jgi:hypothetical protein
MEVLVQSSLGQDIYFGIQVFNSRGTNVLFADSRDVPHAMPTRLPLGRHRLTIEVPALLAPDTYYIEAGVSTISMQQLDRIDAHDSLTLISMHPSRTAPRPGIVNLRLPWRVETNLKAAALSSTGQQNGTP